MEILFFGSLTDITKTPSIKMTATTDLHALKNYIFNTYPNLPASHIMIAVDNKLIHDNIALTDASVVAFMPPYSGG